ncbi:hypothetical protein [Enterobacter hormaechei]|uniref:hypothetical protein n=1 Tax=Enterobacter hormaechei TaxID=158836 RepID=UPI00079A7C15|nr:hypothetical protein [Enterobacter hormaechei]CZY59658.1 Uncharacterised protein [Enterobacter hormaechei]CZY62597.1 Uncharacterised protein [Enterobacter hormaechei]CZY72568.1 Uncharacterised protein [Enterobacter hormaechei]SAF37022.1 Uncharacterised protein [Enterobacter hormaechei]
MKEFKGTPGPWVASKTDRSIGPVSRDDDQSYGMILPVAWVEFDGNDAYQQANANLIAAAPDLFEALQCLVKSYDEFRTRTGRGTKPQALELLNARAAISKALGEE